MFGFVMADPGQLSEEETARYHGCYCGLCRTLGRECGQHCRLTLTYDLTLLILVLHAVYGGEEAEETRRCAAHRFEKRSGWVCEQSTYAAHMNAALFYYKCIDDWQDDRKVSARLAASALSGARREAERLYPRQCESMRRELEILSNLEKTGIPDPERTSAAFGRLMGELFVLRPEEEHAAALYHLGENLGRFIYLADAAIDLKDDLRNEKYNPLTGLINTNIEPVLTMLMANCTAAAESLPLMSDRHLIQNILYSGVWLKYRAREEREEEKEDE